MKINIGCYKEVGNQIWTHNICNYEIKVKMQDFDKLKYEDIRKIVDKERGSDYTFHGWCPSFKRTKTIIARM